MAENVYYQPSVQSDLFQYLNPQQQAFIKPILRILKTKAQIELCTALIDYLETGIPEPPATYSLGVVFMYVIHNDEPKGSNPDDRKFIYPLHRDDTDSRQSLSMPKHIGTIIKQMFNSKN